MGTKTLYPLRITLFSSAQHLFTLQQSTYYFSTKSYLYGTKLLSEKEKERMFAIVQPPYGYGWFIEEDSKKGKTFSHGGDILGYITLLQRRLKDKILIVILGNLQSIDREVIVALLDNTLP